MIAAAAVRDALVVQLNLAMGRRAPEMNGGGAKMVARRVNT
jgi:hypothetical protein